MQNYKGNMKIAKDFLKKIGANYAPIKCLRFTRL